MIGRVDSKTNHLFHLMVYYIHRLYFFIIILFPKNYSILFIYIIYFYKMEEHKSYTCYLILSRSNCTDFAVKWYKTLWKSNFEHFFHPKSLHSPSFYPYSRIYFQAIVHWFLFCIWIQSPSFPASVNICPHIAYHHWTQLKVL